MPTSYTLLGDGTITIGTTPKDFSCEVLGWHVTHTYEEVGAARTPLCGTERPASKVRSDGMGGSIERMARSLWNFRADGRKRPGCQTARLDRQDQEVCRSGEL